MQWTLSFSLALAIGLSRLVGGQAEVLSDSPISKVVTLLRNLEAKTMADREMEQQLYDRSACWCEDMMHRKAKDIADAKAQLEKVQPLILQLEAEVATHTAEAEHLKKALAENLAGQQSAREQRDSEHEAYQNTKAEDEQSIGALEAAVNALAGAGRGKTAGKFLDTSMRTASLLTAAASLRHVLARPLAEQTLPARDLHIVQQFALKPAIFLGSSYHADAKWLGALQVGNNPFGDYAPSSTQIQGILKSLYDQFSSNLEKVNGEESVARKSYEELMATKQQEAQTLQASLEQHSLAMAEKSKAKVDSKVLREDTKVRLEADEKLFEETKDACSGKSVQWSERSRLRLEELHGMGEAIKVLTSPESTAIFEKASSTLLQVSARSSSQFKVGVGISERLQGNLVGRPAMPAVAILAQFANRVAGGHFDEVIAQINNMIELVRREEQDDMAHRDRCQGIENENTNDIADLEHAAKTSKSKLERLTDAATVVGEEIDALKHSVETTKSELEKALEMRNNEQKVFQQALLDDQHAIELIVRAIASLSEFYKKHGISLALVQSRDAPEQPQYTVDPNKMTETFDGAYEGRKSETAPVIALLATIKEDLEKEILTAKEGEAAAQADYEKGRDAMRESLTAQQASQLEAEKRAAELTSQSVQLTEKQEKDATLLTEKKDLKDTLETDCAWVKTHFQPRMESRKAELQGLQEAKDFLAGAFSDEVA